jgi:hypothetical protein
MKPNAFLLSAIFWIWSGAWMRGFYALCLEVGRRHIGNRQREVCREGQIEI